MILIGSANVLHGGLHVLQFIQSVFLVVKSTQDHETGFLHSPLWGLVWAALGILSLYIGIKDFRHHRNHKDHE